MAKKRCDSVLERVLFILEKKSQREGSAGIY